MRLNLNVHTKKGEGSLWSYLMGGIIALLVVLTMWLIFSRGSGKAGDVFDKQIAGFDDFEGDGIKDFQDDCPCVAGEAEFGGCPTDTPTAEDKRKLSNCATGAS